MGTGKNVGVVGRETGVGIELAVLVVAFVLILLLPSEVRDWGLRVVVGICVCDNALGGRLSDPDCVELVMDDSGRKADGARPPDLRLTSLSFRGDGEGESSMINTHPELLPGVMVLSSTSTLCRLVFRVLALSGDRDRSDDLELATEGEVTEEGPALAAGGTGADAGGGTCRVLMLPIRILGTRV